MGGKDVTLTVEQARQLKVQLEELFGVKVVQEHHHHHERRWPSVIYSTERFLEAPPATDDPTWKPGEVWCQGDKSNATAMLTVE